MTTRREERLNARQKLIELIKERGCAERGDPITLASGMTTNIYLSIPGVLSDSKGLRLASGAMFNMLMDRKLMLWGRMTAIGGPAHGAYPISISVVHNHSGMRWFSVRPQPKDHGIISWIDGAQLSKLDRVVLIDDVASTGHSLFKAYRQVVGTGAEVIAIAPLVDRGEQTAKLFYPSGIPYLPLITYADLGIPPLGAQ